MSHSEMPEQIRTADAARGISPGGEPLSNHPLRSEKRETTPSPGGGLRGLLAADNAWRPILTKALSIGVAMLALAAIGIFSARAGHSSAGGSSGEVVVTGAVEASHGLSSSWLAGAGLPESPQVTTSSSPAPSPGVPPPGTTEKLHDPGSEAAPPHVKGLTDDGKVILNLAEAAELVRLPGVGKKRAEQIVQLRTKLGGRFKKPTDLLRIRGIGVKSLRKMLPHLVLDAPEPATGGAPGVSAP